MLRQRVIVTAILLPIGLVLIAMGGMAFMLFIALILGLAAWEYAKIFIEGGYKPAVILVIAGTVSTTLGRGLLGFFITDWLIVVIIFASMIYHMVAYERGRGG